MIFMRSLKHPEIARVPWRKLGQWSLCVLAAAIVTFANRMPQLLLNYTTTWPLKTFYAVLFISLLFVIALYLAGAILLLGIAWFFVERAFGPGHIPTWSGMRPGYYRDAICVAIFGAAALTGLNRLPELFSHWPLLRHSLGASVPEGLDVLNPGAGVIASSISSSFLFMGLAGLVTGLIALYIRPRWMRAGLLVLYAVLMATNVATTGAFFREAAFNLVVVTAVWFGVTRIVRFNMLGYFLLAATAALVPGAIELMEQPNPYFHVNGYAVFAFALAMLIWPLIYSRRNSSA